MPRQTQVERWKYTTKKSSPTRFNADDHPDHKYEHIRREDTMVPHRNRVEYCARCSCGWTDRNHWGTTKYAKVQWEKHMVEALKQQELPV